MPFDEKAKPAITYRGCAMPWHCDQMGHVNSRHLYAMFDDATAVFLSSLGASFADSRTSNLGWVDVHQTVEFLDEICDGMAITVRTQLAAIGRSSITFTHEMTTELNETPSARMQNKAVRFDLAGRESVPLSGTLLAQLQHIKNGKSV